MKPQSEEQIDLFDYYSDQDEKALGIVIPDTLKVVKATFVESVNLFPFRIIN